MADTLEGLRSQILDSIKGRKLGLDSNGYLVGQRATRAPVTAFTSNSTGTTIPAYGHTTIVCASAATIYNLAAPVPGVTKTISNLSTGGPKVVLESGNIRGALGATNTFALWTASSSGQCLTLFGESSSVYQVVGALTTGITVA